MHSKTDIQPNSQYKPNAADKITQLWLEITPKCNLSCIHCYADSHPSRQLSDSLQFDDWSQIIEEASRIGCKRLQFIGGEPTLHPDLARLIRYSKTCGILNIEVYTNGTTITAELQKVFETHNIELAFSVYAEKGQIHDEITRVKGSQKKTLESIKWALNKGLSVRVGIIKMEANAEQIEATQTMLRNMGVKHVGIDFVRGIGRGKNVLNREIPDPMKELCGNCAHGRLCITSTGEIYPCVFARFCSLGNAADGLENILKSAQLKAFQMNLQKMHAFGDEDEEDEENYCNPDRSTPCQPDEECGPTISCHPDGECQPRTCTPKRTGDDNDDY